MSEVSAGTSRTPVESLTSGGEPLEPEVSYGPLAS